MFRVNSLVEEDALVVVKDVWKFYGRAPALKGVSLSVRAGEIYALLGPNGAGKTTLLKVIVGLLKPSSGSVKVCGYEVRSERLKALSCLGYVPENPVGFDYLTVREFLEFVGSLRGVSRDLVEDSAAKYLAMFGIEDKEHEFMGRLSRGSVQKVLVTAALMHRPKVLVMDEPISGMDPESQRAFKDEVRSLASRGAAVLISSHMLDTVEKLCTRVGVISKGSLIAEGTLEEVRRKAEAGDSATLEEVFLRLVRGA